MRFHHLKLGCSLKIFFFLHLLPISTVCPKGSNYVGVFLVCFFTQKVTFPIIALNVQNGKRIWEKEAFREGSMISQNFKEKTKESKQPNNSRAVFSNMHTLRVWSNWGRMKPMFINLLNFAWIFSVTGASGQSRRFKSGLKFWLIIFYHKFNYTILIREIATSSWQVAQLRLVIKHM